MISLAVLLVAGVLVPEASTFLWGSRSSSSVVQQTHHFSTNNCMCLNRLFQMMSQLGKGGLQGVGKREAAAILDLDEDYPGLEEFMEHADTKRDGVVDTEEFKTAVRRQAASMPSQSNNPNICHCGRMVVDQFRRDL